MGKIHILAPFPGSQVQLLGVLDRFSTTKLGYSSFVSSRVFCDPLYSLLPGRPMFSLSPFRILISPSLMRRTKQIHAKPLQLETLVFMYLKFVLTNK